MRAELLVAGEILMRVLITGMGGELGTRTANAFEADETVEQVVGVDSDPPRLRIRRAEFHRVDPRNRHRVVELVRALDPHLVVHLGVYEPNARAGPRSAAARTEAGTISALGAAASCPSLEAIVVRSGIEVYGRRRGAPTRPDERVVPDPTSPFGRTLLHVERLAADAGIAAGVPVTTLRCAPIVGSHLASPLGRYLRLPVVPVSMISDLPFSMLALDDAVAAIVAATKARFDGPLNVVGPGAVTSWQAARLGGRIPWPIVGPQWRIARVLAELAGAPLPDHAVELLTRGRTADGGRAADVLGVAPSLTTLEVVKELFDWGEVAYMPALVDAGVSEANDTANVGALVPEAGTNAPGFGELVRRRLTGAYEVDPWGLDTDMVALLSPVLAARWSVTVHDADRLPDKGGVVVVYNRRFSLSAPFVIALGLARASGRWIRVLGAPDIAPAGTVLRWFGAVPGGEEELGALLRNDQVAAVPLAPEVRHRYRAGAMDAHALAPAVDLATPVVPVAMLGRELGRRWHIHVGEPITPVSGAGPLAVAEMGERARGGVQGLLDELRPSRWLFG